MRNHDSSEKRRNRHQKKRKDKHGGSQENESGQSPLNVFTRAFRKVKEGSGVIIFAILVGLYMTDFYNISSGTKMHDEISISERVRMSQPISPLMENESPLHTVTSLPGSIKDDGKKFDADPVTAKKRDPNTLPGAIGLTGSFDENEIGPPEGDERKQNAESPTGSTKRKKSPTSTASASVSRIARVRKKKVTKNPANIDTTSSDTKASQKAESGDASSPSTGKTKSKGKRKKRKKKKSKRKKRPTKKKVVSTTTTAPGTSNSTKETLPSESDTGSTGTSPGNVGTSGSDPPTYEGPHPMNRKLEELQVAGGTGKLEENAIREIYTKLVRAYLKPFEAGIKRRSFFEVLRRKTYSLTPPGANKGVQTILFQIIGGKVYLMDPYEVSKNAKPFYRSRIKELIWLLTEVSKDGKIPDTEFLLAIHDCVQTVSADHTYRGAVYKESHPTFTIVSCNFSDNIPFPMWEGDEVRGGLKSWDEKMEKYKNADDTSWHKKKEQAVFRGGNRPSMYFKEKKEADSHCNEVGRSRLVYIGEKYKDLFDVAIGGTCGGVPHVLSHLSEAGHHKYKYILYAEGNCFWADRLNKQVFGPSVVIKQETPCGQFWEPLMKPMTHYIPTNFFFTDTVDQVNWAKQNDDKVQAIVKNANEFASNFLSVRSIKLYVEVLLVEYSKLLSSKTIRPERGSKEVTAR